MQRSFILLLVFFTLPLISQNISGKAYYQSKSFTSSINKEFSIEKRSKMEKANKYLYEKSYVLSFNGVGSNYKEEDRLLNDPNNFKTYMAGRMHAMTAYTSNQIYKDISKGRILEEREFLGKIFMIEDTLPQFDWRLEKESKKIGDYTVFKATTIIKIDHNDYRFQEFIKKDAASTNKKGNMMVTAWYTPQIPISTGPDVYSGLPGLILELYTGGTTYLCSKIILNTPSETSIKPPRRTKTFTYDEFEKIVERKKEEQASRGW